jgi:outer membrane lipoprotein-sorting protein
MNIERHRLRYVAAAIVAILSGAYAGIAMAQTSQQSLPKAEQILDRYVDAIGGLAALEKINNRVTKATMAIAAAGVKVSLTVYHARPNKAYTIMESSVTGKIESGTNGEVVWQMSATAGPQVMEGKEKAGALYMNIFDRLVYWRKNFKQVELTAVEDVAGKPCYKIILTPQDLPPQTIFFDKESALPVKAALITESQAGTIPSEVFFSDYQPADGILIARKTVTKIMGQERITTLESIEQNISLPAGCFELPAEIKAIVKKNP